MKVFSGFVIIFLGVVGGFALTGALMGVAYLAFKAVAG